MNSEFLSLTIVSILGLFLTGYVSFLLVFDPKKGEKFINISKVPWVPWTMNEEADGILKLMTFLAFFVFLCLSCFILYGWIEILQ